jgi:YesN/AraC family two-component response regulator
LRRVIRIQGIRARKGLRSYRAAGGPASPSPPPAAKLERSPQQARMEAVSRDALVQAALQEITQNYREASLSNVARAYGVSLAYVSECVRAQTGRTYKELLQKHRMETAARLLRRSDLNIQQIIAQVGYENTSYFYRLFHERYGLSPREYRLVRTGTAPRRPTA